MSSEVLAHDALSAELSAGVTFAAGLVSAWIRHHHVLRSVEQSRWSAAKGSCECLACTGVHLA